MLMNLLGGLYQLSLGQISIHQQPDDKYDISAFDIMIMGQDQSRRQWQKKY